MAPDDTSRRREAPVDSSIAHDFNSMPSEHQKERMKTDNEGNLYQSTPQYDGGDSASARNDDAIEAALADSEIGGSSKEWVHSIKPMHIGLAVVKVSENDVQIGYSVNDGVYSIDFAVYKVDAKSPKLDEVIVCKVIQGISSFSSRHLVKFISAGVSQSTVDLCPVLPSLLWSRLDILPFVIPAQDLEANIMVDELADSCARKALMWIGPKDLPRLGIVSRNRVDVDAGGIRLCNKADYEAATGEHLWRAVCKATDEVKKAKIKIAFFSATPQGGGVALMRHAMIRFFRLMGVSASWHVPKPNPAVFRITKTNHNILQGVSDPKTRLSDDDKSTFSRWITNNAERYWLKEGGPLAEGGADFVIVDDPQMVGLIPMIKKARPKVPVIYRSHIEIRSDLTAKEGSPQAEVWQFLWNSIKECDIFVAHPVANFVPKEVPIEKVGMLPATTDWLDGLNKRMADWDLQYYMRNFAQLCDGDRMNRLDFPSRGYICQVARFDPSKGIPDVIESFRKLRLKLKEAKTKPEDTPQLLICGHGAIDDPDGTMIYDQTCKSLDADNLKEIKKDIVVMRLGPSDQMLNALLSNCRIALQLSHREGFEVKVSEALHKCIPVVAYQAGGIPLQVVHGKNGFLVEVEDTDTVAKRLFDLWTNADGLYDTMRKETRERVSDEVFTVGNAAVWSYLATRMTRGEKIEPHGKWLYDIMRDGLGESLEDSEPRLPRGGIQVQQ